MHRLAPAALCVCFLIGSAMSQARPVRLDSSDWWSYTRREGLPPAESSQPVTFQNREPAETNFRIAGITLDAAQQGFSEIRSKFGDAVEVQRGDAASARSQICYVSASGNVHLIFEFGEVNSAFYLFEGGRKWSGSQLCAHSDTVSMNTSTASGLRLDMEPQQVKSILGDPNISTLENLVYYFGYKKKTTAEELAQFRKSNPQMSDAEFNQDFAYADGEVYVEARFVSEKLNYLAISRSETF